MNVLLNISGSHGSDVLGIAMICLWVLGLVVHVAFALAVRASARGKDTPSSVLACGSWRRSWVVHWSRWHTG